MRLTVTTFLTLDGVMQGPGGPDEDRSGGFEHGGWVAPHFSDDTGAIVVDLFAHADAFLLGRTTYDLFAAYWPKVTDEHDPVAGALNKLPKYVVTSRPLDSAWEPTTVLAGDVATEVARLKQQPGDEIQVHGSGRLAQSLLAHGLVDEYRLWFFPVVVGGQGNRLFDGVTPPTAMRLVGTRTTSSGVVVCSYRPDGPAVFEAVPGVE